LVALNVNTAYLKDHPDQTLSSLVQQGIKSQIRPRTDSFLALAGFAHSKKSKPRTEQEMREDAIERPEDEPIKRGQDRL
jgi:hypothetical protein